MRGKAPPTADGECCQCLPRRTKVYCSATQAYTQKPGSGSRSLRVAGYLGWSQMLSGRAGEVQAAACRRADPEPGFSSTSTPPSHLGLRPQGAPGESLLGSPWNILHNLRSHMPASVSLPTSRLMAGGIINQSHCLSSSGVPQAGRHANAEQQSC